MAENIVINGTTYPDVETVSLVNEEGETVTYKQIATVPNHWNEYLASKIETIKGIQDAGGKDCFSFVVIADPHYSQNLGKNSGILARKIMDECNIRYALILGDFQNRGSWSTKDQVFAEWDGIRGMFAPVEEFALFQQGNHDGSWGKELNGTTYPYNLTPAELHNRIYAPVYRHHNVVTDDSGTGYYVDDTARKVRYILLNTHCNPYVENEDGAAKYNNMQYFRFTQSQYDLVVEALSSVPGDTWAVVVAAHAPINGAYNEAFGGDNSTGDHVNMRQILTAYKNKTAVSIVWDGTGETGGDETGGYTNLYDATKPGALAWDGSKFYTNWMPFDSNGGPDGLGTVYHFKGGYPYKFHFAFDENGTYGSGTNGTGLAYVSNATAAGDIKDQIADYDGSVKLFRRANMVDAYKYIRFEIHTNVADSIIITGDKEIVEATGGGSDAPAYDAVSVEADFSAAKGELVGYFSGHIHNDYHYAGKDGWGIDIITTRCDGAIENDSTLLAERVAGTTTEQSFDVFTVDRKARKIYRTKIGAGEDQVISV